MGERTAEQQARLDRISLSAPVPPHTPFRAVGVGERRVARTRRADGRRRAVLRGGLRRSVAASDTADPSYSVLHGLYWLVANLAEQGLVTLAIDDAHWADGPSLRFVAVLARRLQVMGILIALASRRGEHGTRRVEPRYVKRL